MPSTTPRKSDLDVCQGHEAGSNVAWCSIGGHASPNFAANALKTVFARAHASRCKALVTAHKSGWPLAIAPDQRFFLVLPAASIIPDHADAIPSSVLPAFALRPARARRIRRRARNSSRSACGNGGRNFSTLNPAGTTPVLSPTAIRRCRAPRHRRISRRDRGADARRAPAAAGRHRARASKCAGSRLVPRQVLRRGERACWSRERIYKRTMRAEQAAARPTPARSVRRAQNIRYHLAYIGWLARTRNWLAGERMSYRRSRGGRASVGRRLSGRRAVERGRGSEDLVRAGEVAPDVPAAAGRDACRDCRRRRATPTSTSERSDTQGRAARGRAQHGFDAVGVTQPDAIAAGAERISTHSLADGEHGDMDWLATHAPTARRSAACCGRRRARVIMLGMNYGPDDDPLAILAQRERGAISVYAQGDDYHDLIKGELKAARAAG